MGTVGSGRWAPTPITCIHCMTKEGGELRDAIPGHENLQVDLVLRNNSLGLTSPPTPPKGTERHDRCLPLLRKEPSAMTDRARAWCTSFRLW